jgi:hypothetical protein
MVFKMYYDVMQGFNILCCKCCILYRRRGECSAGGVAECKNVPGCCPEKYDAVYGDVSFGE